MASDNKVTFWGAARTVTGSMHLVQVNGRRILLDCGLYQGPRAEAFQRNRQFPFAPKDIHALVLSHAHIDHCGNLPNLVRQGFSGPIYCTPATRDLMAIMLADSAKIQEEDADYLNHKRKPGEPVIEPLYRPADVQPVVNLARTVEYGKEQEIAGGVRFRYLDAGHLLGSAMVAMSIQNGGREQTLTFTGDLGRKNLPILRDPEPVPPADFLISESTYGGRTHPPPERLPQLLAEVVRRTSSRGGMLLIPAFAVGRSQAIVYALHQLMQAGSLPELSIFVDSPLAANATEVFRRHPECFDQETAKLLGKDPDLFGQRRVRYVQSLEESKQLNKRTEPCIIIAASGMCENGRILHHLKNHIEDSRTTIVIAGFQAPHTLGRRLVEKQPEVHILNQTLKLRAEVVTMNGFSSHADHNELMAALLPLATKARQVCLVHGDLGPAEALAKDMTGHGFAQVAIPERGQTINLPG
jgi:metallo-beta-lactamase family protein